MKKFKFNLETVLRIKNRAVDEETRKLALVVGKINRLKNEVQENRNAISYENDKFTSYVSDDIGYLRVFENYIKTLYLQNENLKKQVSEQDGVLQEAIDSVVVARKSSELLEIIKQKRLSEYHERVIRSERSEEDEESQKDYLADRRGLQNVVPDKEPITITHNHKRKVKSSKNQPKNEYEKIMEYVKGLSTQK
jgi:flagellar biosynthesis chaperone FliJ